ncbi:MAG: 2-polyprenyl-3-methyl-6-methoxy-1,4-benzoquinone monooxygenase [Betaproteobacteria bacterium]|nr:2-polyprenyl-3-methyl-6-methoxy-1,4-benzoquinone monooxygenase [Betaproteobacteria bacterium]
MADLDALINAFDRALRTVTGGAPARRPSPAEIAPEHDLTDIERHHAAALMRVNHCGEVCAQALYQGQSLASSNESLRVTLDRVAREEEDHLAWSEARIKELGGRTSLLNPFWYAGSFALGFAAGRLGDRWNLGFLKETERQVEVHLTGHLERLSPRDDKTRAVIERMRAEEAGHAHAAEQLGASDLPLPIRAAMQVASKVMTGVTYYV